MGIDYFSISMCQDVLGEDFSTSKREARGVQRCSGKERPEFHVRLDVGENSFRLDASIDP